MAVGAAFAEDLPHELEAGAEAVVGGSGVMVGDDPLADAREAEEGGGVGHGGVPPANAGGVLTGCVLRFVDEEVSAADKLDEVAVGGEGFGVEGDLVGVAAVSFEELVVGHVGERVTWLVDAETKSAAGVVAGAGVDFDVPDSNGVAGGNLVEVEGALQLVEADGEVVGLEDLLEGRFGILAVVGGAVDMDDEVGAVEGLEEGEADHVVPVVVADDQVYFAEFGGEELIAERPDAGAGIDDDLVVGAADLEAGGVSPKAGVVGARDWDRAARPPQLEVGVLRRGLRIVDFHNVTSANRCCFYPLIAAEVIFFQQRVQ